MAGEERPSGGGDDENDKYPFGFRFKPTTAEIVEFYLLPKLLDEPTVPNEFVIEANAYGCDPEILTEKYKENGVDNGTWYFLSPRYRKYPGGDRPVRRTADDRGRWKPSTGQSKPPEKEDASTTRRHSKAKKKKLYVIIGNSRKTAFTENTLAYYVGSTKGETKTKWLMHELVVPETPDNGFLPKSAAEPSDGMLLNRHVVCKIYKSPLRKWRKSKEAADVPTSSQSSGCAPECHGEAVARASSSSRQPPAKRTAVERPASSGHTGAPNKGVSQTTFFPGGRLAPTRGNGGGGVRMPPVGAGAGEAGRHGPGLPLPALVHHWPLVYNRMHGPVQMQQPPLMHGYSNRAAVMPNANGQAAPGQGPPVLKLRPPNPAAATAPNSQGPTTIMMRPPNLAAGGQPARLPSPRQQPPPPPETGEAYRNRVYATLIAEMKLQKAKQDSAAGAGQQRIGQTASARPACSHDEGGDRPAGVEVTVPPAQSPAPHGGHPYSSSSSNNNLAQRSQRQQSSSATPAAVEKPVAAENVPF